MFSFTKRKGPTLGVDINSDGISVLRLERTKMGMELTGFARQPTPPNTLREGLITDPETLGSILRQMIQESGIPLTGAPPVVNVAVPGQSVVIRLMPVPTGMPQEELADVVAQEAINHVPFPISEANLDWSIMAATERTDGDGVRRVDVILAAIQKSIVDAYWSMADTAGVKLGRMDTSSLATIRCLAFSDYLRTDDRLIMTVNIRHDATDINLVRKGMPLFTRSVLLGIDTLAEAISRSLDTHLDEAMNLLPRLQLFGTAAVDPRIGQATQIARTVFGDIIDEVGRSLEFYRSQVGDVQVEQIVLCGPGCLIPQVDQFISNRLNVVSVIANPLRDVVCDETLIPEAQRPAYAMTLGTLVDPLWTPLTTVDLDLDKEGPSGGALEGMEARPTVKVFQEETPWFKPVLAAGLAAMVLVAAAWGYFSQYDVPKKQTELAALDREITAGKSRLQNLGDMRQENLLLTRKKELLDEIITQGHNYAGILQAIRDNTPDGVQVRKVTISTAGLSVEGRATEFAKVSHLAINLGETALLKDSTVAWVKRQRDDADPRVIEFSVTAKVKHSERAPKIAAGQTR